MNALSQLTPAETWLILLGEGASLKSLLKYTFLDLLLKQVLVVKEVEKRSHPRDPVRIYKYIMPGIQFPTYKHRVHEVVFLSPFLDDSSFKILFKNLVRISYEKAESDKVYYTYIIANSHLKVNFHKSFFQKLVGGFSYTEKGVAFKRVVEDEMATLQETLPKYMVDDREKAKEIMKAVGGNIFLLKNVNFSLSDEMDKEFQKEMTTRDVSSGCSSGCWGGFDRHSETFDNSCSSHSGSDGGGDGCSGCGGDGCGGCGGD